MCGWDRIVVRQAHRAQAAILKGRAARVQNCHLYTRPWKAMPTVKRRSARTSHPNSTSPELFDSGSAFLDVQSQTSFHRVSPAERRQDDQRAAQVAAIVTYMLGPICGPAPLQTEPSLRTG